MARAVDALRWEIVRHLDIHADWLAGRCRLVATRRFPFAGMEYRLPGWALDREPVSRDAR